MPNTDKKIDQMSQERKFSTVEDFYSARIPKSFQLGGLTIDVDFQEKISKEGMMLGAADYVAQKIRLNPTFTQKQTVEQAFSHELIHWILFIMGESELCNNEKFVDIFAHFLYQAIVTAEPHPDPDDNAIPLPEEEMGLDLADMNQNYNEPEHENIYDHAQTMEEDAIEEDHLRASQEAGNEDAESYHEGMARSEDEGWFYGDDD